MLRERESVTVIRTVHWVSAFYIKKQLKTV
jgi:hypothetical protein